MLGSERRRSRQSRWLARSRRRARILAASAFPTQRTASLARERLAHELGVVCREFRQKVWSGLLLPVSPRWSNVHENERDRIARMDFRTSVQRFIMIPAQIIRTGPRTIYRLLAWCGSAVHISPARRPLTLARVTHWCPPRAVLTRPPCCLRSEEPLTLHSSSEHSDRSRPWTSARSALGSLRRPLPGHPILRG